jgi:hypothetical protein
MTRKRDKLVEAPASPPEDAAEPLGFVDVREAALFLVRIFGEEAREIAASRAELSDQSQEWRRVGKEVNDLLEPPAAEVAAPKRRRFRAL